MDENTGVLTQAQIDKITKPYAHNTAPSTDFKKVAGILNAGTSRDDTAAWSAVSNMLSAAQK